MAVDEEENLTERLRIIPITLLLGVLAVIGWFVYTHYLNAPVKNAGAAAGLADIATAAGSESGAQSGAARLDVPRFDVVRVTRGGAGLVTGHAPPAATVNVLADGRVIGEATADAKGEWILIFSDPLKSGGVELSLQLAAPDLPPEQAPVVSPLVVVVVVPDNVKDHFVDSEGEGVVVIASPRFRMGSSVIMQRPGRVTAGETTDGLGFDALDYGDDGKAVLSGRAPAFAEVRAYVDNHFEGRVTADQHGKWELSLKDALTEGAHVLRADQVNDKGKVQLRLETPFARSKPINPLKTKDKIITQATKDTWLISRKIVADGYHYTQIFRADKDQVKDPDQVYPGQVVDLPPDQGAAPAGM